MGPGLRTGGRWLSVLLVFGLLAFLALSLLAVTVLTTRFGPAAGAVELQEPGAAVTAVGEVAMPPPATETARGYHRGANLLWLAGVAAGVVVPLFLLFSRLSSGLGRLAWRVGRRWYPALVVYLALLSAVVFVLEFPLSVYGGFIREHLYGLATESFGHWLGEALKALLVGVVVGAAVIWVPYLLLRRSPRRWWLYTGLLTLPFFLLTMLVAPLWIAPLFDRFQPLSDRQLETKILALADRAGIEAERVFEVDKSQETRKLNAYVTGLGGSKRIVLWDTLAKRLDDDEVLYVMGHEMGHYVLGHVWRSLLITWATVMLVLYGIHRLSGPLLSRWGPRIGINRLSDFASLPLLALMISVGALLVSPLLLAHSRHLEREADRFALELTRDNPAGITAFRKLQQENLAVPDPGPLYELFRASHPSIADRVRFIASYRPWASGAPLKYDHLIEPP